MVTVIYSSSNYNGRTFKTASSYYNNYTHYCTAKIVEDYPFGDEKTTMETNGPWRTTINVKTTEDASECRFVFYSIH